jgi:hypothetical protein
MPVYFSHHKVATGWTTQILSEAAFRIGLPIILVHNSLDPRYDELVRLSKVEPNALFLLTNATPTLQTTLDYKNAVHAIRDPRDIIVSAYYSHKFSHAPWDEKSKLHFQALHELSTEEGLCKEIEFSSSRLLDMQRWNYQDRRVDELRYEQLVENPFEFIHTLFSSLTLLDAESGLSQKLMHRINRFLFALHNRNLSPIPKVTTTSGLSKQEVAALSDKHSFERLTGRRKGTSSNTNHLRNGLPGDWKNHFTDVVTRYFKSQFPTMVSSLHYESDENW